VIAAALIVYGIAFIVIETVRGSRASGAHFARDEQQGRLALRSDRDARVQDVTELDWPTALGIGAFQVLSLVPGTSRSGSTIIGGLLLGCSRAVAAEFTFYLAIPVMVGAGGLRLVKYFLKGNMFSVGEFVILGVGCLVAFLVSMLAIRFLMNFVKKHDFKPFGWYRIALGVAVIAYFVLAG
jgi:undecaprenyl-diphosphatase